MSILGEKADSAQVGLARILLELVSYIQENQIKYSEINQQMTPSFSQIEMYYRVKLLAPDIAVRVSVDSAAL